MDCKVFNNRLEDFQMGKLPKDLEAACEKHMEKCTICKGLYVLEQDMNASFSMYFDTDQMEHHTVRNEVMGKIDRKRYGKNPAKKVKYSILADKKRYMTAAAVLLFIIFSIPFIKSVISLPFGSAKTSASKSAQDMANTESAPAVKDEEQGIKIKYYAVSKPEALKMINEEYNVTKAVISPDNKKRAMIYGKGSEMIEEGYSKIVLQDINKNQYYVIEMNDESEGNQLTVKEITWRNNDNILAIIGSAYGMATRGGNVYNFNLNTRELSLVYKTKDDKTEVTSIKKGDEFHYILNINEYADDSLMDSKQYQENITIK